MDQKKIGLFLKELRKEKGITQEAFAEKMNVSGRTVSRWETGSNLPDISLIPEIAEFYGVDVGEIIEGKRKSEKNEEAKDVANKMADYAVNEKSKILKWVRMAGLFGVLIMTGVIIFQCSFYDGNLLQKWSLVLSVVALIIMIIVTLHVNGLLERVVKKKAVVTVFKVIAIVLAAINAYYIACVLLVLGMGVIDYASPFTTTQGTEKYDKVKLVQEYGGDLDSGFFVFPDSTDNSLETTYESKLKTGLFDTDGYIILETKYTDADFNKEIHRLENITCEITFEDETVSNKIVYDENMYNYPAYITSDGFDYNYEYALIDKENNRIIYIHLSYPEYVDLTEYHDYLKRNSTDYYIENDSVLEKFTIYAHKFDTLDGWIEYSDME